MWLDVLEGVRQAPSISASSAMETELDPKKQKQTQNEFFEAFPDFSKIFGNPLNLIFRGVSRFFRSVSPIFRSDSGSYRTYIFEGFPNIFDPFPLFLG